MIQVKSAMSILNQYQNIINKNETKSLAQKIVFDDGTTFLLMKNSEVAMERKISNKVKDYVDSIKKGDITSNRG